MKSFQMFFLWLLNIITILSLTPVIAQEKSFSIEKTNNLEGLWLNEIGVLKLIVEFRVVTFPFNMSDLADELENSFIEKLTKIKQLYESQLSSNNLVAKFKNSIADLEKSIKKMKHDMQALTSGNVRSFQGRQKRFFPFMTSIDEGARISEDLKNLFETVKQLKSAAVDNRERLINISRSVASTFSEQASQTMLHQNQTIALEMDVLLLKLQKEIEHKKEALQSIQSMMKHRKLESTIISVEEMSKKLKSIGRSLNGTSRELPFNNILEYFSKVAITHNAQGGVLTFRMKIPIVESGERTLYQIEKVPTRVDNKLIILDTQWSYLANTSDQVVKFASLHQCFKTEHAQKTVHLCELQSTIHSTRGSKDCLTKSFVEEKIDLETCESFVRGVQFSNLTFIKRSEGRFFYFTQQNENLQIFCNGKESVVTLEPEMGMVKLSTGCVAKANHDRLLVTDEVDAEPVWSKVLNVPFDKKQIGELDELRFERLSVSYLYKSVDDLNKIASSSGQAPEITIFERNYKNDIIHWLNILVFPGVALILFLLYLLCRQPKYAIVATRK